MIKYAPTTKQKTRDREVRSPAPAAQQRTTRPAAPGVRTIIATQDTFGCDPWFLAKMGLNRAGYLAPGGLAIIGIAWMLGGFVTLPFSILLVLNDFVFITTQGKKERGPVKDLVEYGEGQWSVIGALIGTGIQDKMLEAGAQSSNPEPVSDTDILTVPAQTIPVEPKTAIVTPPPAPPAPSTPTAPDPANLTTPITPRDTAPSEFAPNPFSSTPAPAVRPPEPSDEERSELLQAREATVLKTEPQGILAELFVKEDGYFSSWFVMGVPRTGKGVCLAYSLVLAQAAMPGVEVLSIDAKADPVEYTRWGFLPRENRYHFKGSRSRWTREEKAKIRAGVFRILRKHEESTAPYKLLVIDELPAILRVLDPKDARALMDYCNGVASQGPSTGSLCWIFSNSITLQGNGVRAADMAYYMLMYLATPRKLSSITNYREFTGPVIAPDDPVFKATGRAGWASTLTEWQSIPVVYNDLVKALPHCTAPANFGSGDFDDSEGAIALLSLAEQLADQLVALAVPYLELSELVRSTTYAGVYQGKDAAQAAAVSTQLAQGLKEHEDIVILDYSKGIYNVRLPGYKEQEATTTEPEDYWDGETPNDGALFNTSWMNP